MIEATLAGRVAVVTGAGRGTGEEIARKLAAAGAKVAVNDINPDRAERVAAAIRASGGEAIGVAADVSNKFQCVALVEATREAWGRLDVLVNSASVEPTASVLAMDEWDWDRCLAVNLKGTFFMSQLCGRVMVDENRDRGALIINIGASLGRDSAPIQNAAFLASKAGVLGLARACGSEFSEHGIRVCVIVPEGADSQTAEAAVAGRSGPDQHDMPLLHPVRPEGVADLVCSLCAETEAGFGR